MVINGLLDLSTVTFTENKIVEISGEWKFYNHCFLKDIDTTVKPVSVYVPKDWNDIIKNGNGFGTYKVKLILPHERPQMAILVKDQATAYMLYVNNAFIGNAGIPAKDKTNHVPRYEWKVYDLPSVSDTVEIAFEVSNFSYRIGGLWNSVRIGEDTAINKRLQHKVYIDLFLFSALFILAIYHFGIFFFRLKDKKPLFYAILCAFAAIRTLVTGPLMIHFLPNFSWEIMVKAEFISLYGMSVYLLFQRYVYPEEYSKRLVHFFLLTGIVFIAATIILPVRAATYLIPPFEIIILIMMMYVLYGLIRAVIRKRPLTLWFSIGFVIGFSALLNDILNYQYIIQTAIIGPWGVMINFIIMALALSKLLSRAYEDVEILSNELMHININLEMMIDERTEEINRKNQELSIQNYQINDQRKNITDSLIYASRIQNALMSDNDVKEFIPHNLFVYYKPCQIVSGDFYFLKKVKNTLIIAAADCTGHGVPGAFMSMLGIALLNEIVNHTEINEAGQVLNLLRKEVISSLNQTLDKFEHKDGMDIGLCMINLDTQIMQYAGAYHPLYIIRKKENYKNSEEDYEFIEYKADGMPIGVHPNDHIDFHNHIIPLKNGDQFYLFSDGYMSQFGGDKNKKYKKHRFQELLINIRNYPMLEQKEILDREFENWRRSWEQVDDILVIGFKVDRQLG